MLRFLAVALVATLVAQPARAQLDTRTPNSVLERAKREDWVVRATQRDGQLIVGRVLGLSDVDVRLDSVHVSIEDIARIERSERVGEGGRTGMVAGAVILGTSFVVLSYYLFGEDGFDATGAGLMAAAGVVSGAILGGLIGGDLDPTREEWRHVWPGEW